MAEEQKVYELVDKGPFYVMYRQVKMEDAMNVFWSDADFFEMYKERAQIYNYAANGLDNIVKVSDDRYGTGLICVYEDGGQAYIALDLDGLLAHAKSGLTDPKVKVVPYALPTSNSTLMMMNSHTVKFGFGYSQAKGGFIRKQMAAEKKTVGKAPINEVQRHVASALDRYLRTEGDYSTVRITTTGSKVEMHNTVVILKRLGLKLEDCFSESYQETIPDEHSPIGVRYVWRRRAQNMDWFIGTMIERHKLTPLHQKQIKKAIQKWWDEATEKVS